MSEILVLNEENYVVKANQLIEAKGRLGTLEQKLFAALVSEIQITDEDFKDYNLKIKDVAELIGLNTNAIYERLKEAAENLTNKPIKLESVNEKGKKKFIITRLISSAQYQEGEGYITIHFDPVLKPYLLAINGKETPFTKYLLNNILKLNNSYSIRLYELLKQCEKMKWREFTIDDLKEFLGADTPSYNIFAEFERRVLKNATTEINEKTDIWVEYEKIKIAKKIGKIKFTINSKYNKEFIEKEKDKQLIDSFNDDDKFLKDKEKCGMSDIPISKADFYKLFDLAIDFQEENAYKYMALTADYVLEKKPKYLIAYLKNALKKNYINF